MITVGFVFILLSFVVEFDFYLQSHGGYVFVQLVKVLSLIGGSVFRPVSWVPVVRKSLNRRYRLRPNVAFAVLITTFC